MEQQSMVFESKKVQKLKYLVYLPKSYSQEDKWPFILFLHGAGERGDNLESIKKYGIQERLLRDDEFPFIVVSPQCPANTIWEMHFDLLTELLDEIEHKLNIDKDRMYLTGLSLGGYGAWNYAMLYPQRFAAVVPVSGGAMNPKMTRQLKDVPVWVFHGEKDQSVSIEESRKVVDVLRSHGGNVRFTIFPDAGHEVCTTAYENEELYAWLLKQKKIK